MSHPKNKRERFLLGDNKGKKRADIYVSHNPIKDKSYTQKIRQELRNTTKPCSCAMCGNPRKFFNEKTLQEKRIEDSGEL